MVLPIAKKCNGTQTTLVTKKNKEEVDDKNSIWKIDTKAKLQSNYQNARGSSNQNRCSHCHKLGPSSEEMFFQVYGVEKSVKPKNK
jgi:hypothetical protein